MTIKVQKIDSWNELKDVVNSVPIETAAYIREDQLDLSKRGYQLFGICPFHSDERVGNFALGGPHNGFKCFACGKSGDIIDLVMKIDGVGFKQALVTTAVDLDIMLPEDADKFIGRGQPTYIKEIKRTVEDSSGPYIELDEEQIAWRDAVYSLFSQGDAIVNPVAKDFGLKKKERLSNKHYYHLKEVRGLSDEQIKEAGFFTMKRNYKWLPILYYRLYEEKGYSPNTLNVPGFWRIKDGLTISNMKRPDGTTIDFNKEEHEEQYYWFTDTIDALGIPIRDTNGRITAIQLRPDDENYGGKYIWFSSTFATGKDKKIDGLSAGAQQDVTIPKEWNTPNVFITEGKFKSLAIAKVFRSSSISLQGVNTFKDIGEKIDKLNSAHKKDVENIIVAFDADLSFNDAVINAVTKMVNDELTEYNVHIAIWDHLYGKGIDDLINNGHLTENTIVRITPEELTYIKKKLNRLHPLKRNTNKKENKEKREQSFYKWLRQKHPQVKLHSSRSL